MSVFNPSSAWEPLSSAGGLWSKRASSINIRGGSDGFICILTIPGCAKNADSSKDACEVFVLATRTRRVSVVSGLVSSSCTSSTAKAPASRFDAASASPRIRFSTATSSRSASFVSLASDRRFSRDSWYRSEHNNDVPASFAQVKRSSRAACRTDSRRKSTSCATSCDDGPASSLFSDVRSSVSVFARRDTPSSSSLASSPDENNDSSRRAMIFRDAASGTRRSVSRSSRPRFSSRTAASNCFSESLHKLRAVKGSPGVTPMDGACDTHAKKNASNTSAFAS
mmetsp:Transcript_5922/g.23993  ORF Transcript_5922/g.23993 Transcript_5922/m.23993 type:complete len:282 (+) Transcript_5922:1396-2241(+)